MIALANDFKLVQAHLAGAVTIITTSDAEGCPRGFTATSFCSLSLDPPLVLFCLDTSADSHNAFMSGAHFAVNILSAQQRNLSQLFATKGDAKYQSVEFEQGQTGVPLLPNCLAYLECSIHATYPGGDHSIIVGLVRHGWLGPQKHDTHPLLYYTRTYGIFTSL
ncbi:MAG TPA: flavin reductase family protein [Ktedonobacteraceae bacterium]|nr:flavin reductase family protein [Ktedonobacteraceae bacterium]